MTILMKRGMDLTDSIMRLGWEVNNRSIQDDESVKICGSS